MVDIESVRCVQWSRIWWIQNLLDVFSGVEYGGYRIY